MQVLVVEPDRQQRESFCGLLEQVGATVTAVESLDQAQSVFEQTSFEIVCTGWLADFEGLDGNATDVFPQKIHASHSFVCLAQRDDRETQKSALQAGFRECYYYDLSALELRARLAQVEDIKQLHDQLAQAKKLESIGELAAGIAHEINTPIQYVGDNTRFVQSACEDITAILEVCQSLIGDSEAQGDFAAKTVQLQETMDDADVEYLIEEIPTAIKQSLEGVERVAKIVRAMKEFAHPGVSEMTPTDIGKAIENTVMVARNEWKYVAELETEFDPSLPLVPCLPGELNQVLLNMIVNAAHAIADTLSDSVDRKGKIQISTALAQPFAEIRIKDTGSGIPQENIERIFKPFFTTKSAGKGTGQGLAIAHSVIVEKHQGTIQVESNVGEGTTFVIRIPLAIAKDPSDGVNEIQEFAASCPIGEAQ